MTDNIESGDIKIHYCLINFILASRSFYCLWFDDGPSGEIVGVYDKLFYGNNLPALKKESAEVYIPIWERDELDIIQAVFNDIKRIFHTCLGNLT